MMSLLAQQRALACHSETPSQSVRTMQARVSQARDGGIAITYLIKGQISRLSLPAKSAPSRVDGLWQHTCFEAFISVKGAPAYREFNFAPSGEWAAYALKDYRDRSPLSPDSNPQIKMRVLGNRLEVDALIRPECLPPTQKNTRLLLGL